MKPRKYHAIVFRHACSRMRAIKDVDLLINPNPVLLPNGELEWGAKPPYVSDEQLDDMFLDLYKSCMYNYLEKMINRIAPADILSDYDDKINLTQIVYGEAMDKELELDYEIAERIRIVSEKLLTDGYYEPSLDQS